LRIIESKLREEFGDAVIDALRQGRYVVSGSAGYNPPLLVSLKGRELIQGRNPEREEVPAVPEAEYEIPTVKIPSVEIEVEYPVANAVELLQAENPISSGFMAALNQKWTIVFRGRISEKAVEAAKKAALKIKYREMVKGSGQYFTDVYLPEAAVLDFDRAKLAFDHFAEEYSRIPKRTFPIGAPTAFPLRKTTPKPPAVKEVKLARGNPAESRLEPWQMTLEQYAVEKGARPAWVKAGYGETYRFHKRAVERAFKEGKPVPPEVLADYPDLRTREGNPDTGTSIIDLRGDYDEIAHVKDGILYRKGNIVQVWWDKWGKETWTGPSKEQARENFNAMKERWSSSELGNPKEPWQMTEAEWAKIPQGMQAELTPLQWRLYKDDAKWIHLAHENLIHDAVVEGKPVPAEVLKDYPDLAKKHSNPEAVPEITDIMKDQLAEAMFEASEGKGYFRDVAGFRRNIEGWTEADIKEAYDLYVRVGKIKPEVKPPAVPEALTEALIKEGDEIVTRAEAIDPNNASVIEFRRLVNQAKEATTTEAQRQALTRMEALEDEVRAIAEVPKPPAVEEVKLGGGNPIPDEELDLARTLAIIDSRPKGRIIESKLREEFGDAVIDALRQGRYVVSGSAGYNPPLLVSLKGRELIQRGNPMGKVITKEEAIGLLERLSMTPGEAARSLVADEAERMEIMQTVQQRVKREQNKWAPMDPREGPPLPRIFAGLRWPWKK